MKPIKSIPAVLAALATFFSATDVKAATFTWAPGSNAGNKNWNQTGSWQGGIAPSVNSAGNDFVFGGNFKLDNIMEANYTVGGISFASGAGAFTLGGVGTLTLGEGGFVNNSVLNQTIAIANLSLNADQVWNAASGNLTFSGTSLSLNGFDLDLSGGNNIAIANAISGAGGINKLGSGALSLTGDSTYAGATTVGAGTLAVNNLTGSATGSGAVTIGSTATLTGGGTIGGSVTLQGGSTLNAGNNGTGLMTTGSQIWNGGSIMKLEINQANGTEGTSSGWDKTVINGSLTLQTTDTYIIDLTSMTLGGVQGNLGDFDNTQNYSWKFVETTGGITGFSESAFDIQLGNFANDTGLGDFNIFSDGNSLFLTFTPVPEPSTIAMGVLGGVMVFGSMFRRRRMKK